MNQGTILIIGANGQIGTALLPMLQDLHGTNNVISSDLKPSKGTGRFEHLDATDYRMVTEIIQKYKVKQIYHLAAVLSAKAESDPIQAWNVNMQTLLNVLEAGRRFKLTKIFIPSSIAVFGGSAPTNSTPQNCYLDPSTIYGISKVAAENWMLYYYKRFNLDIRSLRYPGVISYQSIPDGGTTDYAVDMYHKAITGERCLCYLSENTRLPMIYIEDALRATVELMEARAESVKIRSSYNLSGFSFTPAELCKSVRTYYPDFVPEYIPDFRQKIANSWPQTIDDSSARRDWGWVPQFDISKMTKDMVQRLSSVYLHNY